MSEYKVGDRVRVVNRELGAHGKTGEVADVSNGGLLRVEFGFGPMRLWPAELELIDTPTPDVVQYPADGHPDHYTAGLPEGVAAVDVIKAHLKAGGTWDTANALKYLIRHPLKENPTQDIKKAIRCLNMWVAEQEAA